MFITYVAYVYNISKMNASNNIKAKIGETKHNKYYYKIYCISTVTLSFEGRW